MPTAEVTLVWLAAGAVFGLLLAVILSGRVRTLIAVFAGAVGAFVIGLLFGLLRLETPPALAGAISIRLIDVVLALIGAVVAVLVVYLYRRLRRRLV